tara:strand:+ start:334 stop:1803 length:1470 start_codon:yes stop_codon:yes gene_type:complete
MRITHAGTSPAVSPVRALLFSFCAVFLVACIAKEPDSPITVSRAQTSGGPVVFQNVSVFDSESLQLVPNRDVIVRGNSIEAVVPSGGQPLPEAAHVVDGEGTTLVPGLIDMHGHISITTGPSWEIATPNPENNLRAYAYAGVTTVFDPGDSSGEAAIRREQVAEGELLGPRIFTAGRIITDPHGHPRAMVEQLAPWWIKWYLKPRVATGVATPEEAVAAVEERQAAGVDAIKVVVDSIPLEADILPQPLLRTIVDESHRRGLRVVAHIGTTRDAIAAAENGVDLWVHGIYKERIPDEQIATLAAYGIPMVTTSEVFDRYGRAAAGPIDPTPLERETVSAQRMATFYPPPADFDAGPLQNWVTLMQQTREARLDNVRRLHAAGVTILAGSDTQSGVFPGAGLHRELATLVEAGLTPAEAIRAATLSPARFLASGREPDAGAIAAGKRADLLLVEDDPTRDIAALAEIREVMLNGSLLTRVQTGGRESVAP